MGRNTWTSIGSLLTRRSVRSPSGCLLWGGSLDTGGYGVVMVEGRPVKAHRVAWTVANGPIPDGLRVLHTCDVRNCIEPSHLWLGTQGDNIRDMWQKGRQNLVMSGWNKGRPHPPETRAKIAAKAQMRPRRFHTPESKAKMSAARAAWWRRQQP